MGLVLVVGDACSPGTAVQHDAGGMPCRVLIHTTVVFAAVLLACMHACREPTNHTDTSAVAAGHLVLFFAGNMVSF